MEQEQTSVEEKAKPKKAEAKSEPKYEGNLQTFIRQKENLKFMERAASDYGYRFYHNDKEMVSHTIPGDKLQGIVTIADLYKQGKIR